MKSIGKKIVSILLAASVIASMGACSGGGNGGAPSAGKSDSASAGGNVPAETTLKVFLFGQAENMDKVLDRFYSETKDTLNTKLDIVWNDGATHKEKIPLMMSNQEEADLVFDAYWMNLSKMHNQGAYADLSKYFNNDQYPGLKKAFSEDYLKQVTDSDGKIFAVPFTQSAEDIPVIYLRKDLREKYGMGPISSNEDLENYFKKVKADIDAGALQMVAPFGVAGSRGFYYLDRDFYEKRSEGIYTVDGSGTSTNVGMEFEVAVSEDGKKVLGASAVGDPDSVCASFPTPFNKNTKNDWIVNKLTKWAQYSEKDAQTEKDAKKDLFFTGKVAATESNISQWVDYETAVKSLGGELEAYVYSEPMRDGKQVYTNALTAWNFLCVPQQSKKIDATMKLLDWLFSSRENHDLFEYGIEGEDYKAVGTDEYTPLTPENKYTFPGYEMTWNPNFVRTNSALPDDAKKIVKYQNDPNTYLTSKIAGFTFNTEATPELKTAYASVSAIQATYGPILLLGLKKNPADAQKTLEEYYAKVKAAGLDVIRQAVIDQVQKHLDQING